MVAFGSRLALALLAVLAVGGTLAPVAHQVVHAGSLAESRAQHLAADHHHHESAGTHGAEVVPPCPEPLDAHLTCVLCTVTSGVEMLEATATLAPETEEPIWDAWGTAPSQDIAGAQGARGPPVT